MKKLCIPVTITLPEGVIAQSRVIASVEPLISAFVAALTEAGCEFTAPIEVVTVREKKAAAPVSEPTTEAPAEAETTSRGRRHAA